MDDNVISSKSQQIVDCDRFFSSDNEREKFLRPQVKREETLAKYTKIKEKISDIMRDDPTVDEICLRAQISRQFYYNLRKLDPEWTAQIDLYRAQPKAHARAVIIDSIKSGDVDTSKWYLERKAKNEFGKDNKDVGQINITITSEHAQKILELDTEPDTYEIDSNE